MGENEFAAWPVAFYGIIMLGAAIAYFILARALIALYGRASALATALERDFKGKVSVAIYVAAIPFSFVNSLFACGLYVLVAVIWLLPDRRIEKVISRYPGNEAPAVDPGRVNDQRPCSCETQSDRYGLFTLS